MAEYLVVQPSTKNGTRAVLGDATSSEFVPRLRLSKWDGEVEFSVEHDLASLTGNKVFSANGDVYTLDTAGVVLNFYPKQDAYEFELTLKNKPKTNTISLPIAKKNLAFLYQPPLDEIWSVGQKTPWGATVGTVTSTDVWDDKDKLITHRDEDVIGSYAVYHASKKGDYSAIGGYNYMTGKVMHIYRPKLTDDNGATSWATLEVNESAGRLIITADQAFLDGAAYPVVVDPTFGYNPLSHGESPVWMSTGYVLSEMYACPEVGVVASLSVYAVLDAAGANVQMGVYSSAAPAARIDYTGSQALPGSVEWVTADAVLGGELAATDYRLCLHFSDDAYVYYDSGSGNFDYASGTFGVWADSYTFDDYNTDTLSIYCTYDIGGDAPDILQANFQFFEAGDDLPTITYPVPPVVESSDVTEDYNNTASTSWDIARPAQATGDLIIMHLVSDANVTHGTLPGGPNGETAVVLAQHVGDQSTATTRSSVWYWKATGNNAAGTVTVTPSATEQWRSAAIRVLAGEFDATTPIEYGDVAVATSGAPNIPAFTPTYGYGRAVGYCGVDADAVTGAPSGWTLLTSTADRGAMNLGVCVCDTPSVASTEIDGGNFAGVNDGWVSVAYLINAPTHAPVADGRTPLDDAGADPTLSVDTDYGVSIRVENTGGDTEEDTYKWQYKLNSGSWDDIATDSDVIIASATEDFADGDDVEEYIGGDGDYVDGNNAAVDEGGSFTMDAALGGGESFESHLNFQIVSGDVVNGDKIYLRIVGSDDTEFDSYGDDDTNIPEITVSEGGAALLTNNIFLMFEA
jgi:hypothetical protein